METAPCPISGSTEFTVSLQVPDRFDPSGKEQWQLVCSNASGLVMLNPRPESSEIACHYHSGTYDPHLHTQNSSGLRDKLYLAARSLSLRSRASIILQGVTKPLQQLSILEIGCSTGDLLHYFHQKKRIPTHNLAGVEPDTEAATHARKVSGVTVCPSIYEESLSGKTFDRIVLWHTLEHIHAINETLEWTVKKLQPEGVVVIALPNPASSDAKHYRENWIAWDAPRHLFHFTPDTLKKLLEAHNLTVFRQLPYPPDALYNIFHSEKLLCKRHNLSFHPLRKVNALWRGVLGAVKGQIRPEEASSLVFFARKR